MLVENDSPKGKQRNLNDRNKDKATPPNDQSSLLTRGLDVEMLRVVIMSRMQESCLEQGGDPVALFLSNQKLSITRLSYPALLSCHPLSLPPGSSHVIPPVFRNRPCAR